MWMRVLHQGDVVFFAVDPSRLVVEPLADCERFRHEVEEQSDALKLLRLKRQYAVPPKLFRQEDKFTSHHCSVALRTCCQLPRLSKRRASATLIMLVPKTRVSTTLHFFLVAGSGAMLETLAAGNVDSGFHSRLELISLIFL